MNNDAFYDDESLPLPPPPLPPGEPELPEKLDFRILLEALLRSPQALAARLAEPGHGATKIFAVIALVSFLVFGVILGCFAKHEQLWAAPLKVSAGVFIAGAICFPSLYIFSTLAGARMSLPQLAASLAGALALAGLLLLGFSPAIWIFAESTDSLGFMGFLGIAAWIITVLFAAKFLYGAIRLSGATLLAPLRVWGAIFMLVSLQMTTSLSPILGHSDKFLTQEKKFFIHHWVESLDKSVQQKAAAPVRN